MTKEEKIIVANQILSELKKDVLKAVEKMPDDFNGVEIKQFVADYYKIHFLYRNVDNFNDKRTTRRKVYETFLHNNS